MGKAVGMIEVYGLVAAFAACDAGCKAANVTVEPFDKNIIANLGNKYNIFHRLILLMKLETQTYYNIRMILGLQ